MHSEFENLKKLEKIFKIKPENFKDFKKALTHSSFTKENNLDSLGNFERLEFLGDAVLKLCVSEILFKKFPKYSEGDLTKIRSILVSDNILAKAAKKIKLDKLLILGKKEEQTGGREKNSILACAFEAVLGAYFLEGKYAELSKTLEKIFKPFIKEIDENFEKFNAKAVLQEYTQAQNKMTPVYKIIEEKGPQHNKIFVTEVSYMEKILAEGKGKTKREAEQNAALQACKKLGAIK